MKTKDLVALIVAAVIFLAAGYIVYTQLLPKKAAASDGVKVEVVGTISPDFNADALSVLSDSSKTHDYSVPLDLTVGLNNQSVFGQ